jgi:parallel beta-helix repeat protein
MKKTSPLYLIAMVIVAIIAAQWLATRNAQGLTFTVTNTNDSGAGSLRQAIIDANATSAIDVINFNIPGSGVHTLNLTNFLPFIDQPIIIDGTSQPGWSAGNPVIEINGANTVNGSPGLRLLNIPSGIVPTTVKGLIINNFPNEGILIENSSKVVVTGCFIGTDATGTQARGNFDGIVIKADVSGTAVNNIIGGTTLAERNIITGNFGYGIVLFDNINHTCHDNHVTGNYIGTDKTGMMAIGAQDGVFDGGPSNFIGGTAAGEGNVISGSSTDGLIVSGADNVVQGNLIGTAADGVSPVPNHRDGVRLSGDGFTGENNSTIGGITAAAGNVIAFNEGNGVNLVNISNPSTGNRILRNAIHDNGKLGIDLNDDGVTANDTSDPDTGVNNLQNSPRLTSATYDGSMITIVGSINSTPSTSFRIEFFVNSACDGSGSGEGETFLNSTTVTTSVIGGASFNISFGTSAVGYGQFITATATRNAAPLDTSEFSPCEPVALPTFVVTNTNDSGAGSLRQAITNANADPDLNLISFNIPGAGVKTIAPASAFSNITSPVVIDGLTQTGATCTAPLIELNGTNAGGGLDGLLISAGNSLVQGLVINRFSGDGISLITNGNNTIKCNRIGTNAAGNTDLGNGANGILLSSSSFNTIQDNTISGNALSGIRLVTSSSNVVQGNIIGLSSDGLTKIANSGGIAFFTSGSSNVIGGTTAAKRNIISGNTGAGVSLRDAAVNNNTIQGNYIGVNPTGSGSGFGNTTDGIQISLSSANNLIGGTAVGAGNTIAFNGNRGIVLLSTAGTGNQMRANSIHSNGTPTNFIGIDLNADGVTNNDTDDPDTGPNSLQNFPVVTDAASYAAGTVLSGIFNSTANTSFAIDFFSNSACDGLGNGEGETYLGSITVTTNASGDASFTTTVNTPVPVGQVVTATATRGTAPFDTSEFSVCRTVTAFSPTPLIVTNTNNSGSGSLRVAITTANANADVTVINFNIPGAGVKTISLTSPLPPLTATTIFDGLSQPGATCTTPLIELDGTSAGAGADGIVLSAGGNSVIKGIVINRFDGDGIEILNSDHNVISCNRIGTNAAGTAASANNGYGVFVNNADSNTIGGTSSDGNLISGNGISGVQVQNGDGNKVQGNIIGLNAAGSAAIANTLNGVHVLNANHSLIGGASSGARNIISGNTATGVVIEANGGSSSADNVVQGNFIGTNLSGNAAAGVGNSQDGLRVSGAQTTNTLIGGGNAGEGNVISNNAPHGFRSLGGPDLVTIKGNFIGTNSTGTADAGNVDTGVSFSGTNLLVGGTTAAERNIISGNTRGIFIGGLLTTGTIQGNYIGLGANGSTIIGNIDGIVVGNALSVLIGGTTSGAGNVVSGNNQGLSITSDNVTVQGNFIGTDATGTLDKGNSTGVFVDGSNNLIGGTTAAARNVISGNATGILLQDTGTTNPVANNAIKNNFIGTDVTGTVALSNSSRGIFIVSGNNNVIGGSASEGNIIAFSNGAGVIVGAGTGNRITANSIFSNGFAAVGVLGIDLGNNGVTMNDNLDGDSGANNLQNFPVITSSMNFGGTSISIQGTLNSTANTSFQIDFYSNTSCDPSGNGEGQTHIGTTNATTNGSGNGSFNVTFNVAVPVGRTLTATATDGAGNTSEFSACLLPTAIELAAFTASAYDDGVLLEWRTGMEVNNLGFNLYRDNGGKLTRLNSQTVAGSALAVGAEIALRTGNAYQWWDSATADQTAAYWLEDLDLTGASRWHGPFYATQAADKPRPGVQTARTLAALNVTNATSAPLESRARVTIANASNGQAQVAISTLDAGHTIKLAVKREGFYRVAQAELIADGLDTSVDPRRLQLFAGGREQAINVTGESDGRLDAGDALEFYGQGLDSPFSDARTYYLVTGAKPGRRITRVTSPAQVTDSGSFAFTIERRDRSVYFPALRNGDRENFFGAIILAQPINQSLNLPSVEAQAKQMATLRVGLQGVTGVTHSISLQLNGVPLAPITFDGQAGIETSIDVPPAYLREGENVVTLAATAGPSDISLVDFIRLTYQRRFTADDDALVCTVSGNQPLTIDGFSGEAIRVFDITTPDAVQEISADISKYESGERRLARFRASLMTRGEGQRRLLALTDERARKAYDIHTDAPSSWRQFAGADFVIVTSAEFADAAELLKALRQSQGLATVVVAIEDIYDEFSFGEKSPFAVRDFFAWARGNWKRKVAYALFLGDASYDPKNYLGLGETDIVPTRIVETQFLETASDDWFADFNGDGISDFGIGRLPAHTLAEAKAMIEKIVAYEKSAAAGEALLVSDRNDGYDFEQVNAQVAGLLPAGLRVTHIRRRDLSDAAAKAALIEAFNRGPRLVNYAGHGSANGWRGDLLTSGDAGALVNGERLPLVVAMNCLNGYFHDPTLDSIAEALLKTTRGGAVAVWASSAMTFPDQQARLNSELYRQMFAGGAMPLGDLARRAKAAASDPDVRRTWVLLGDPTMRIK